MSLVYGIDVSHWQGPVNWPLVATTCGFAFAKATEGMGYVDPLFVLNWKGIRSAGLLRGAYHFARVSGFQSPDSLMADAHSEADWFMKMVGSDRAESLPPVLDLEWDRRSRKATSEQIIEWALAWLERVESQWGVIPIVYTGYNFWRYKLGRTKALFRYHLWLAQYKRKDNRPKNPIPGWGWEFWQFTGKGRVTGVTTQVDRNVFPGSPSRLRKFVAEAPYETQPPVATYHWDDPTVSTRLVCQAVDWWSNKRV